MKKAKYIHLSKLDVAKRQLDVAIQLFLNNSDVVAIHTLTAAAHEVLRGLSKQRNLKSFIKDEMVRNIKEKKQKEFVKMINEAENFFKHADRDPDKLLKFYIGPTEFLLWDACRMYQMITNERPPLIVVFNFWFHLAYSYLILDEETRNLYAQFQTNFNLNPENRAPFLNLLPYIIKMLRR